jgi:hypothetical protein
MRGGGRRLASVSSNLVHSEDQITPVQQQLLHDAYRQLRTAVVKYETFIGRELKPGQPVPVHDFEDMAGAQRDVEAAERELWRLREELLGWVRPSWAPGATLVADWLSDEDAIYDEMDAGAVR